MTQTSETVAEPTLDYSDDASTFGDRIVAAREALGMDAPQLAKRLGIKKETLNNWEDDRSEPRANKLQMLAGVLNVSIIWLMSGQGQGVSTDLYDADADGELEQALRELREIRHAQGELASRLKRVERKLRATAT